MGSEHGGVQSRVPHSVQFPEAMLCLCPNVLSHSSLTGLSPPKAQTLAFRIPALRHPNCFSTPPSFSLTPGIKMNCSRVQECQGQQGSRGSSDYRMGQGGRSPLQKSSPLLAASEPMPLPGPQAAVTALSGLLKTAPAQSSPPSWACGPSLLQG